MARYEPLRRSEPGAPPHGKVVMRRDENGNLQVVLPAPQAKERAQDDERPAEGRPPEPPASR